MKEIICPTCGAGEKELNAFIYDEECNLNLDKIFACFQCSCTKCNQVFFAYATFTRGKIKRIER